MADVKKIAEQLVGLTVKEVQELADVLKADYGIEPAAAAAVAVAGGGGAEGAAEFGSLQHCTEFHTAVAAERAGTG